MKYIFQKLWLATFFLLFSGVQTLWAGPERYDHLREYKLPQVSHKGPTQEVVAGAGGEQIAKALYFYNKNNQIAKVEYFKGQAPDGRSLYIYDENGLAEERLVNAQDALVERIVYQRNKEQNVVSYTVYDKDNEKILTWKFSYKKGRMVSGVRYSGDQITERFEKVYKNNSVITTLFHADNEAAGIITSIIQNNRVTTRSKNDLTGNYRIEYRYDERGRLTTMTFYQNRGRGEVKLKVHQFSYGPGNGAMSDGRETTPQSVIEHATLHESDRALPEQK